MDTRRYTVTTRTWAPTYDPAHGQAVLGSFAKKGEAIEAAKAAMGRSRVYYARVAREVWTRSEDEFLLWGREVFYWDDQGEVFCRSRRITREEMGEDAA